LELFPHFLQILFDIFVSVRALSGHLSTGLRTLPCDFVVDVMFVVVVVVAAAAAVAAFANVAVVFGVVFVFVFCCYYYNLF
jgi:hypothetical protein